MSEWEFKDFAEAMASVNRVADLAEEVNHHPAGGLTENDHAMARRIDDL